MLTAWRKVSRNRNKLSGYAKRKYNKRQRRVLRQNAWREAGLL